MLGDLSVIVILHVVYDNLSTIAIVMDDLAITVISWEDLPAIVIDQYDLSIIVKYILKTCMLLSVINCLLLLLSSMT